MMLDRYAAMTLGALERTLQEEREGVRAAGAAVAASLAAGGVFHVFGSGHSELVARELVGRSGSLVPINQIVDRTEDLAEVVEGYGALLAEAYDQQYGLRAGECALVVSNSGVNPLPIEIARACHDRTLTVIAITNLAQSRHAAPRHSSGLRLFEIADVVLDNHAPPGEATVALREGGPRVGAIATITGAFLGNALIVETVRMLAARGSDVPVLTSENHDDPEALARNKRLRERYRGRLRRFGA